MIRSDRKIRFIQHLRAQDGITELKHYPQRAILEEKFKIAERRGRGTCKKLCKEEIIFYQDVFVLENYLRICQDNNSVYKKMNELAWRYEIWRKYIIMDTKVTCKKCNYQVEDVVSHPEEKLQELFSH